MNCSIKKNTYAGPLPLIVLSASMRSSPTTMVLPTVAKSSSASFWWASVARDPSAMPVTARPTIAGVFGIARTTGLPSGSADSMAAVVMPAATLMMSASDLRCGSTRPSSTSVIRYGLTATITTSAWSTAARLFAVLSSSEKVATPCFSAIAIELAAVLVEIDTFAASVPLAIRPSRIAVPIEPAPRIAIRMFFTLKV